MRICTHCQLEQSDDNRFCTDCGRPLDVAEADRISEESAFKEKADSSIVSGTATAGLAWSRLSGHLLMPLVSAGAVFVFSIALGVWFASSNFISYWIYRMYHGVWGWTQAEALAVADSYRWSWWHVMAQAHAQSIQTAWRSPASGGEDGLVYDLRLPLIGILLVVFLMIWIIHRISVRLSARRDAGRSGFGMRVLGVAVQAAIYGVMVALLLGLFSPRFSWDESSPLADLTMRDSVPFLSTWWKSAVLYALAAWAGQAWFGRRSKELAGSRWLKLEGGLRLLKRWVVLVCGVMLLIGLLIPAVWSISDSMSFYEQPPSSIVHQWRLYGTDPALLTGMPAFLMQKWLFATGGTVHLEGNMLADLLRLQPMSLHLVTGLAVDSEKVGEPASAVTLLAAAARANWHVWSMLLLVVYGTFCLGSRCRWLDIAVLAVGAGIFAAVAAELSAIRVEMEITTVQRMGHDPLFAAIQTALVSLIAATAGKLWTNRFGVKRTASEVTASGR